MTNAQTDLLYDKDFVGWTEQTAKLLREGRFNEIELEPLIDEVESLGRSDKRQLESRLTVLYEHLLCIDYWIPEYEREQNRRGWQLTINEQTRKINELLAESPSLKPYCLSLQESCYKTARSNFLLKSGREHDLDVVVPEKLCYAGLINA